MCYIYVDHSHFIIPFVYLVLEIKTTSASVSQLPSENSATSSNNSQLPVGTENDDTTLSDDEIASVVEGFSSDAESSPSTSSNVRGKEAEELPARKQRRKGEAQRLKDNLHSRVLGSSEKKSRKKR